MILRRFLATVIDLALIVTVINLISRSSAFGDATWAKVLTCIAFALLYEPVLTAYACTLGQALLSTRVRRVETLGRIGLKAAYIRLLMKYVASILGPLGGVSGPVPTAVSVFPEGDGRALHDLTAGTVVVDAGDTQLGPLHSPQRNQRGARSEPHA